jgi:hypothetical protein
MLKLCLQFEAMHLASHASRGSFRNASHQALESGLDGPRTHYGPSNAKFR